MDRYLLFHGDDDFSLGGMLDFKKASNKIEELLPFILEMQAVEWSHIYDCECKKIIYEARNMIKDYSGYNYKWFGVEDEW